RTLAGRLRWVTMRRPRSRAASSNVGPGIQSWTGGVATTTARTSQPRASRVSRATTAPGFDPMRMTDGFCVLPSEVGDDGVNDPVLRFSRHRGVHWQRHDGGADILRHTQIATPRVLEQREPVPRLPVEPGVDAALREKRPKFRPMRGG